MDAPHIADQLLTASTALAGLLLLFLSSVTSGYELLAPQARRTSRNHFRFRSWLGFIGFSVALLSTLASLTYCWIGRPWLVALSAVLLVASLLIALVAAFILVKDIR